MKPIPPPLRVIIVEDQISVRQGIEEFFAEQPGCIVTGACGTVHDAIVLIHTTKPDLLLLDIGLPDGTGFDILEQMTEQARVIFLTAHNEYAIRAIKYGAIDYLLKPLNKKELTEALIRVLFAQPLLKEQIAIALESFRNNMLKRIALRSHSFVKFAKLEDIIYLQADDNNITVFLQGGMKVVTTRPLKEYEDLLGTCFLRPHQSYLINKEYIDRYYSQKGMIYLTGGTKIPVSQRKKELIDLHFKNM